MTFQIEDSWASQYSRFTGCYKKWCDTLDICDRNNIDTPEFFTWIKETFPEIIEIGFVEVGGNDDELDADKLYMDFKYTFKSEAHYTWFILKQ